MKSQKKPPHLAERLLEWFCAPHLLEDVQGDLHEEFNYQVKRIGERSARWFYWWEVLGFVKPAYIRRLQSEFPKTYLYSPNMIRNYFKIALRNLLKHKGYSFINIFGLATGMAVAMLIGLWIYDELSYNKSFPNYDRIAQVMQHQTFDGEVNTQTANPYLMGDEIRDKYGSDFKYVVQASWMGDHLLTFEEKKLSKVGNFFEPAITEMLSLKMLKGTRSGLKDMNSVLLSESVAKAYFGEADPVGKLMKVDNKMNVKVTGVYEDLPYNSDFKDLSFILPWELYLNSPALDQGKYQSVAQ